MRVHPSDFGAFAHFIKDYDLEMLRYRGTSEDLADIKNSRFEDNHQHNSRLDSRESICGIRSETLAEVQEAAKYLALGNDSLYLMATMVEEMIVEDHGDEFGHMQASSSSS